MQSAVNCFSLVSLDYCAVGGTLVLLLLLLLLAMQAMVMFSDNWQPAVLLYYLGEGGVEQKATCRHFEKLLMIFSGETCCGMLYSTDLKMRVILCLAHNSTRAAGYFI